MREIKFRAWDMKEMIYGVYVDEDRVRDLDGSLLWIGTEELRPKYVMQFTGLKDKNKVEIYEGDIMKWENKIFRVNYSEKSAYFEGRYKDRGYDLLCNISLCSEVIGNIYENPELLK